ncbi:TldD/PmbA family protein [Clostridium sp.]|uniref:TldD/PmbA family protein n=1 Tax=Clostridium sp. TaxID=1506 RepID=UPI0034643D7B
MLNKVKCYHIIDSILEKAKYFTLVTINREEEGLTRFANSEIHQNVYSDNITVKITVIDGKKICNVSTNLLEEDKLMNTLKEAEENIEFLPEGEYEFSYPKEPLFIEDEENNENLKEKFSTSNRAKLIGQCVESLEEEYKIAGSLSLKTGCIALGNSNGIKRYKDTATANFNVVVIHEDGASGYGEVTADKEEDIDVPSIFNRAYEKARIGRNPKSIEPGYYDVILEPLAVGDLVDFMSFIGFDAEDLREGFSFLSGKVGEKVFNDKITIKDDLNHNDTYRIPFDFEGFERTPVTLIDKGVVKGTVYGSKEALLCNERNTGHSIGYGRGAFPINIIMDSGEESIKDIIKKSKKALLITRFHYMNIVDPRQGLLTGLTRDGVFMIEDGEIKYPVKNMRFTETLLNAFNNVEYVSIEREKVPSFFISQVVPYMKINNFHITGKTEV